MIPINETPSAVEIQHPDFHQKGITLTLLKLHETDPIISGNKWFKLKYNLQEAKAKGQQTILTFGGAYSNHIHASAEACKRYGFQSIGIIRGEATLPLNPTLASAKANGMTLHYLSRTAYRSKHLPAFIEALHQQFGSFYLVPEGGSNTLAIKGCAEIAATIKPFYTHIAAAVGTGATLAGLGLGLRPDQHLLGFSALKGGHFLLQEVEKFQAMGQIAYQLPIAMGQQSMLTDYHFGGYAKTTPALLDFLAYFESTFGISLDQVYTGKMMFGLFDLIGKGVFNRGSKILAIHTGGLQGKQY